MGLLSGRSVAHKANVRGCSALRHKSNVSLFSDVIDIRESVRQEMAKMSSRILKRECVTAEVKHKLIVFHIYSIE